MQSLDPSRVHYIEALAAILAPLYGTTAPDILSRSRRAQNAEPRHIIAYTCYRQGWGPTLTGAHLGLDHSSVNHAARGVSARIASDGELRRTLALLPEYEAPTQFEVSPRWLAEREAYTRRLEGLVSDLALALRDEMRILHAIAELGAAPLPSLKFSVVEPEKLRA